MLEWFTILIKYNLIVPVGDSDQFQAYKPRMVHSKKQFLFYFCLYINRAYGTYYLYYGQYIIVS